MTKARILADYVATGVTAAEFDQLDTTSGTPGSANFLRGDNSWAVVPAEEDKVKVSSDDTTPGYLNGKLVAGTNISLTEGSGGADETLTIANTMTAYNDDALQNDIATLALHQATNSNSVKYNLTNTNVDVYQDSSAITSLTNVSRNTTGEYVSTYSTSTSRDYAQTLSTTRANITITNGGWTGAITNDAIERPAGSGGNYPSFYVNYIYKTQKVCLDNLVNNRFHSFEGLINYNYNKNILKLFNLDTSLGGLYSKIGIYKSFAF